MKGTRNTTARRTQRREAREQRVRAGAPSARHDWRCPICRQWFSRYRSRDIIHLRHCKTNRAVQAALDERMRAWTPLPSPDSFTPRSSTPQPGPSRISQSPRTRGSSVAEDAQWDQQLWDDDAPDVNHPQHLEDEDMPGKPSSTTVFRRFNHAVARLTLDGVDPDEPIASTSDAAQDPTTWPLELGETLVVYHPHAKFPPRVIPTKELMALSRGPQSPADQIPLDDSRPPHFPFETLADFEQTELFIKRDHTDPEIDEQLDLWRRHGPRSAVTLKNAREMHRCLQMAGVEEDLSQVVSQPYILCWPGINCLYLKFERVEIQVPYKHSTTKEIRDYTVRFRPALDAVKHVLEDPALRKHLIHYPERHYIRKPGTNENMRVWTDVHTADDWWELQVILPFSSCTRAEHWPLEQHGSLLHCCQYFSVL